MGTISKRSIYFITNKIKTYNTGIIINGMKASRYGQ